MARYIVATVDLSTIRQTCLANIVRWRSQGTNSILWDEWVPHHSTMLKRQAANLRMQIETHITELFGLSTEEMEIIKAVPVPS